MACMAKQINNPIKQDITIIEIKLKKLNKITKQQIQTLIITKNISIITLTINLINNKTPTTSQQQLQSNPT